MALLLPFLLMANAAKGDADGDYESSSSSSSSSMFMTSILGIVVMFVIMFLYHYKRKQEEQTRKNEDDISQRNYDYPTLLDRPILEVGYNLSSTNGPDYFLQKQRELNDAAGVLRFPFHIDGCQFYIVGNHRIGREILDDPKTIKESIIYSLFDNTAGGVSFFTTDTYERSWHVKKSTSYTFSHQNLKRQTYIIEDSQRLL